MYRKEILELLEGDWWTVSRLAQHFGASPRDVEDELEHLRKSLRSEGAVLEIDPATCRKCGFRFKRDRVDKPSKCPKCRSTWIAEPRFRVVRKT